MTTLVTANKRFVHAYKEDGDTTMCHCVPNYYRYPRYGRYLKPVTEEEAAKMHQCRSCFPPIAPTRSHGQERNVGTTQNTGEKSA